MAKRIIRKKKKTDQLESIMTTKETSVINTYKGDVQDKRETVKAVGSKHDPCTIPASIILSGVESNTYWDIVVKKCGIKTVLMSYHYLQKKPRDFLRKRLEETPDVRVFIDSGAYTFISNSEKFVDMPDSFWDNYLEGYTRWIKENADCIFACADLDIDDLVGVEQVDEWREKYFEPLRKEHEIDVCYIWHEIRGNDGWRKMCEKYDYVGLSTENDTLTLQSITRMVNIAKKNNTRVHGMAVTKTDLLVRVPLFSCDSSVDGESSIVVKDILNDRTERLTIEELYNRNLRNEFRTTEYETRVPYTNYKVLTVDNNNKVVWGDLYGVVKHKVKKSTIKLKIEGGKDLICTTDHSIITMDKQGKLKETKADELTVGDYVLAPKSYSLNNELTPFTNVMIDKPYTQTSEKEWQVVELNDKFLQFLGLWVGDGHFSNDTIGLSCYQDVECKEVIDYIANLYSSKVTKCKNEVDCRISSARLQRVMRALEFDGTSSTKRVPKFIYSLSEKQVCQFLKGYFSADGTGTCECSTVSEELKKDLVELLEMLGINCSVSHSLRGKYKIKGKEGNKKESWHISIRDKASRLLFQSKIGFLQNYKLETLYKTILSTPDRGAKRDGIPKELAVKDSFRTDEYHTVKISSHKGRVHRKYDYVFNDLVANSEVSFLEIKGIESVSDGTNEVEVYDLSVRNYERFFANGVLVHNTTWIVGQQYGELNWFDGRGMKRLDKQTWRTTYKTRLLKAPFFADWDLLINGMGGRGDTYELLRLNVIAYQLAEEHIRKRLRTKMYWLRENKKLAEEEFKKHIEEVNIPSLEWFDNGDQDDYKFYLHELHLPPDIPKDEAVELLYSFYLYLRDDGTKLEEVDTKDLMEFCNTILEKETSTRDEAIETIRAYYKDNALGLRRDFVTEEEEELMNRPKERADYIKEEEFVTIDLSTDDLGSYLPAPKDNSMPEVEAYDEELKRMDIVPVRDEKGRFIKGQKKVRKPKNIYSEVMPKLACDTCYKAGDCPEYKAGFVCAFNRVFKKFDTRNIDDVFDAMFSMANVNLERTQRAIMFETMDGGMVTPEVSALIDQNMRLLQQINNLGQAKTLVSQKRVIREDGTEETVTSVNVNPNRGGILSQIFGAPSTSKDVDEEETPKKSSKEENIVDADYIVSDSKE